MTYSANLTLSGLSCASCVGRVESGLSAMPEVNDVSVNLPSETARIELSDAQSLPGVAEQLRQIGYPAASETVTLAVDSMSCASCTGRVERALEQVPGVVSASVNLATETATVTYLGGTASVRDLVEATGDLGYAAHLSSPQEPRQTQSERKGDEARALRHQLLIALVLAVPVFALEMGAHVFPAVHMAIEGSIGHQGSWLIQFVLTTLVLVGPGRGFFAKGLPALWARAPDMNSLVAVGTGAAWAFSTLATFAPAIWPDGARAVYFEAAAVIVVLILAGRMLEARAKGRTGAAIEALMGLRVRTAPVLRDGEIIETDIAEVQPGDMIQLRPGARVPVDGVVAEGVGTLDESMITGEPMPVSKAPGDRLTGGTVNGTAGLTFRATHVGAETVLSQIIRMVEEAQGAKLPIQSLIDKVTYRFVPAVMAAAALTVLAWLALAPAPAIGPALVAGVSVLIIACPCAMGLATPTSIMVGTGRAASLGVLFRKGDALQALSEVDVIAFDKTGTLTEGRPDLTDLILAPGRDEAMVLRLAAAVEARSEHPVAAAIVKAATARDLSLPAVEGFLAIPGKGAFGTVGSSVVHVGSARLMEDEVGADTKALDPAELAALGRTIVYVAIDGALAALIGVSDPVKPASAGAIAALRGMGFEVAMITGDNAQTAAAIAAEVGIDIVHAGVLPDGKVAALDQLAADRSGGIAFVGDGINDAPALARADVGIAIGTGTDVAMEAADVVLMSGDLNAVTAAAQVSAATLSNIRQNLVWAFGYNVLLIPVAAGVLYPAFGILLSPVFAAAAMALSSVSVVTNALRLRHVGLVRRPSQEVSA